MSRLEKQKQIDAAILIAEKPVWVKDVVRALAEKKIKVSESAVLRHCRAAKVATVGPGAIQGQRRVNLAAEIAQIKALLGKICTHLGIN